MFLFRISKHLDFGINKTRLLLLRRGQEIPPTLYRYFPCPVVVYFEISFVLCSLEPKTITANSLSSVSWGQRAIQVWNRLGEGITHLLVWNSIQAAPLPSPTPGCFRSTSRNPDIKWKHLVSLLPIYHTYTAIFTCVFSLLVFIVFIFLKSSNKSRNFCCFWFSCFPKTNFRISHSIWKMLIIVTQK